MTTICKHGHDLDRVTCGNCRDEETAPWRERRNTDRVAAKRYADANGYFWLPCPRCGEWYGGQEWGRNGVPCLVWRDVRHGACCPKVSDEHDREACRRSHEMHGDDVRVRP